MTETKAYSEAELLAIKASIDKAKPLVSELRGQEAIYFKQLEELGCKTAEEAEAKITETEKDISDIDKKIEQKSEELRTKYQLQ